MVAVVAAVAVVEAVEVVAVVEAVGGGAFATALFRSSVYSSMFSANSLVSERCMICSSEAPECFGLTRMAQALSM